MRQNDELVIALNDLIAFFIRKWKQLLAGMIVFMMLFGGLLSYREAKRIENQYSDETLEGLLGNLSENQISDINQIYTRYLSYKEQVVYNQTYLEHSYLMNLDPSSVSSYRVEYFVTSDQKNLISSFSQYCLDLEDYKKIAAILGEGVDERFIYEIVGISGSDNQEQTALDVDNKNEVFIGSIANEYKGMMNVNIQAANKEQCQAIADLVSEAIQEHYERLIKAGVKLELVEVGDRYTENLSIDLANQQQDKMAQGANIIAQYNNFFKDNLSDLNADEQALFEFYQGRDDVKEEHVHWLRYTAIGGIIGLVLVGGILLMLYVFGGFVHTRAALRDQYELRLLGTVYADDQGRGLNRLFNVLADQLSYNRKREEANSNSDVIIHRIRKMLDKRGLSQVFIVTATNDETALGIGTQLGEYLGRHEIDAKVGKPLSDVTALEQFSAAETAVLMVTLNETSEKSVRAYINLAQEMDTKFLGTIVVIDNK